MAHTWDQEMMLLHELIDELEKQNAELRMILSDAIGLCDAALDQQDSRAASPILAETWGPPPAKPEMQTVSEDPLTGVCRALPPP